MKNNDIDKNILHYTDSEGNEYWYDDRGRIIHYKDIKCGYEEWHEYEEEKLYE